MTEIVKFKKPVAKKLENLDANLQKVHEILNVNIEFLKDPDSFVTQIVTGPIYFQHNTDKRLWKTIADFKIGVLSFIKSQMDTEAFKSSVKNSDIPGILEEVTDFTRTDLPINLPIPFVNVIFTLVLFYYNGHWIISDVFSDHRSMNQQAFEVLMKNHEYTHEKIFGETE